MEIIHFGMTGKLARSANEYDDITLIAILQEQETAKDHIEVVKTLKMQEDAHWTDSPKPIHVTGDPLIDKWERELAQGKVPDLDEGYDG